MRSCARALSIWIALSILVLASTASAVAMLLSPVGNAGNAADTTGFGAVGYDYSIGTYEVTNAQYVEFLNAKAAADPLGLYNAFMGSAASQGGITRTGASGSFTYAPIAGRADRPVNFVSFYDALRFANWMSNGQGTGDTETGSYTLLGASATPSNGGTVARNVSAVFAVTSEDEWYKAAYYDAGSGTYFDYTTSSNTLPTCSPPTATPNRGNCGNAAGGPTNVGSYPGSASPYGTYDQGGNVYEWNESIIFTAFRGIRGGSYSNFSFRFGANNQESTTPSAEFADVGFRLAYIPEPGTGLLLCLGLVGMAARKRSQGR